MSTKQLKTLEEFQEYLQTHRRVFFWDREKNIDMSKLGTSEYNPYQNMGYWVSDIRFMESDQRIRFRRNDYTMPFRTIHTKWVFDENSVVSVEYRFYTDIPNNFDGWLAYEDESAVDYARQTGKANNKLKIVYSGANSSVVSDFEAQVWVNEKIRDYLNNRPIDMEVRVGTEYMLNLFVLKAMTETIPIEDVEFYYDNVPLAFNKYDGIIVPEGCSSFYWTNVVMQIVQRGYKNLKADGKAS